MQYGRDQVIVVNEQDEWMGAMDKLEAHKEGVLHRAFSVFVLNDKNELLLQQRADGKYHSGALWSNTCCSHPIPHESTINGAHRRLQEELGFDCELFPMFNITYKAAVSNGLTEHELDHVFYGTYCGEINPDAMEVKAVRYVPLPELEQDMAQQPSLYTPWLHVLLPQFISHFQRLQSV